MKVVWAVVLALVLAAAGVVGGIYYANNQHKQDPVEELPVNAPLLFFPMERFVSSVADDSYSRYLVLELSLSTKSPAFLELLKQQSPVLRNVLVKHFANITHAQAKQAFDNVIAVQQALQTEFEAALKAQGFDSKLEQVLVTNVYLQ